jgi:hypothetical protein
MIKEVFSDIQLAMDDGGFQIDKTKLSSQSLKFSQSVDCSP